MKYRIRCFLFTFLASFLVAYADQPEEVSKAPESKRQPEIVRSKKGDVSDGVAQKFQLINIGKKQHFTAADRETWDTDIVSPKSATFSADGSKFYVNSLEGCKTVVYDATTQAKLGVINFDFTGSNLPSAAEMSGFYPFTHYEDGARQSFLGKPVESTLSHDGRYLWVTFYRRSFDRNAQDPSAVAVIDTRNDSIVKLFETGPLPKMIATSNRGNLIAVTHWGDNTVGFIDASSANPDDWHHLQPVEIGRKLELNYPLDSTVNRDANSGFLLRGTVFTPDDRFLLVSGMAGPLQVIDVKSKTHIGSVHSLYGVRHLEISNGRLYGSQNVAASVVRVEMDSLMKAIDTALEQKERNIKLPGQIRTVKVGGGARTLTVTPDGEFILVACNSGNAVYAVYAETMLVVDKIRCDSYPVGLALSPDGRLLVVTSQGRPGGGGNSVNLFRVERFGSDSAFVEAMNKASEPQVKVEEISVEEPVTDENDGSFPFTVLLALLLGAAVVTGAVVMLRKRKRR